MTGPRVVIVGAGPAGIRAAETLVAGGVRPLVIDEGARAGGQIYRRPPEGFRRPPEVLYGTEAPKARALHACFDELVRSGQIAYRPRTTVYAVHDRLLYLSGPDGTETVAFDRLLLATGATDRLAPVPGWQNAGVYSLGATQIALKSQGVALGKSIVLAGSGPLLTLVAVQLLKAGARVEAVLDTAPLSRQLAGAAGLAVRPGFALEGLKMRLKLGRLYRAGVTLARIEATEGAVSALHWRDAGGSHVTPCDTVALGWHLRSESQLADLSGARFDYDDRWHQWLPVTDRMGRAGESLYLAGDGMSLRGADAAEVTGRLAATACLSDMGLPTGDAAKDLRRLSILDRFASGIARSFPWPASMVAGLPDETILCRCEGITVGELRGIEPSSGPDANRAKSLSRVGMGRCQGRYCHLAGADLLAVAAGCAVPDVGRLRGQPPAKPLTVGAVLRSPETTPETPETPEDNA